MLRPVRTSWLRPVERREQRALLVRLGKLHIRAIGIFHAILGLGLAENIVGALEALQKVFAIVGLEESRKRLGPFDEQGKVIVARHGKAGVNHIVADALVLQEHLEAVVEEGEEVCS